MKKYCIDCKQIISYGHIRCKKCAKSGKNHFFWGKHHTDNTKEKIRKVLTGRKISEEHRINIMKAQSDINHSHYIDGRTLKKHYCIDCNIQINNYRNKRCRKCADRKHSEQMMGVLNPNYINGNGWNPYSVDFSIKLKEEIRKKDNYICQGQDCRMTQEEHFIVYGRDLEIHHIDYNKKNCEENNLITLCKQCNVRANHNRDYWKYYFSVKVIREFEWAKEANQDH